MKNNKIEILEIKKIFIEMKNSMNEINGRPSSLKRKLMKCKIEVNKSEYSGKR